MKIEQTRRDFLRTSVGVGALLSFPTIIPASALGKNGTVAPSNRATIGVIGCGGRSSSCSSYVKYPKSQIVAVCDPVLQRRLQRAKQWGVTDHYNDFREIIARDDVDAVHVVTQDHWHVPISLAAARGGKDVYCEKPLGISIEQDLAARAIVEEHGRVFQYGTQQRSTAVCRLGLELVLNGHIGEVKEVFVWAPGGRSGGDATPSAVPEGFDYNMWLGPAPMAPYCDARVASSGSWYIYDYALGFIGGWGAHPLDILQWWADQADLGIPVEYKTTGVVPTEGLYNTATNWEMEATYANGMKLHFLDDASAKKKGSVIPFDEIGHTKLQNGTLFMGTKGWVSVSRGNFKTSSEEIRLKAKNPGPIRLRESKDHFGNFADSVLNREQPISTLDSAIHSDIISHMGDIGIRTGETLRWDPKAQTIIGSDKALAMMHRPMRAPWTL